jgi:hypothetical protein
MVFGKGHPQWPRDSLRISLAKYYPGCSSVLDAFHEAKKNLNKVPVPPGTSLEDTLRLAIKKIEESTKGLDLKIISSETRDKLQAMPLTTREEILIWQDAWTSLELVSGDTGKLEKEISAF